MTDSCNVKAVCGQFCEYSTAKYPKFIPIYQRKNGFKLPQSKIDKKARRCWFDMQIWHIDYVDEKLFRKQNLKTSHSDSAISSKQQNCQHNCKLNEVFIDVRERKALVTNKRFGTSNMKFLPYGSANEFNENRVSIEFYVTVMKEQQSMLRLCHMKTELIVKCLQIFFKPYNDTTVLWVNDLNSHINKATTSKSKDIFNEATAERCVNVKSILYLDKHAARLLRHKDLCFIDTLSTIVETKRNELLVLPMSALYKNKINDNVHV